MRGGRLALVVLSLGLCGVARAAADDVAPAVATAAPAMATAAPAPGRERPVRFTAGLLAGTGYGWADDYADVNRDLRVSGGNWAGLGHVIPELGLLLPRVRLFVLFGARYQVITGTTDVYTPNFVAHARSSAISLFQKVGWFPRATGARLQPFISLATGRGAIAHRARLPGLRDCGPAHDQECVDTVGLGPWFVGVGTGLRVRLSDHLDAVLAVDAQLGYELPFDHRGYNIDTNLGIAAVF